jgi:hypothetical protein
MTAAAPTPDSCSFRAFVEHLKGLGDGPLGGAEVDQAQYVCFNLVITTPDCDSIAAAAAVAPPPPAASCSFRAIVDYLNGLGDGPLGGSEVDQCQANRWADRIHKWDGNLFLAANGDPGGLIEHNVNCAVVALLDTVHLSHVACGMCV